MKKQLLWLIVGIASFGVAGQVLGMGHDFSKEEREFAGKHCVHGFSNNEETVVFYVGDTARLNRDIQKFVDDQYTARTVVLHSGAKRVESPWDKKPRDEFADWSITTRDDPADASKAVPRRLLQIDVWIGKTIQLNDLVVPATFNVLSGGEIDRYVEQHNSK